MKIRYYIHGFSYDKTDSIFNPMKYLDRYFGDFDDLEDARKEFEKLRCESEFSFFMNAPKKVYRISIQLEKCEVDDDTITCIDVLDEFCVENPLYARKNGTGMFKININFTIEEIAQQLEDKGIIEYSFLFKVFSKISTRVPYGTVILS